MDSDKTRFHGHPPLIQIVPHHLAISPNTAELVTPYITPEAILPEKPLN